MRFIERPRLLIGHLFDGTKESVEAIEKIFHGRVLPFVCGPRKELNKLNMFLTPGSVEHTKVLAGSYVYSKVMENTHQFGEIMVEKKLDFEQKYVNLGEH